MQSLGVSLFLVSTILLILSSLTAANFSKVVNIFHENVTVTPGDVMQCEITKTDLEAERIDKPIYIQPCQGSVSCYIYQEISGKCFSFKVRTIRQPHIIFGNTVFPSAGNPEILLEFNQQQYLRQRNANMAAPVLHTSKISGIVNDREYSGFWVRWLDDELFEVGRESETIPFLYHRFDNKLDITHVGILNSFKAAWIIDRDPKCPGIGGNGTEVQKNMIAESDCTILK